MSKPKTQVLQEMTRAYASHTVSRIVCLDPTCLTLFHVPPPTISTAWNRLTLSYLQPNLIPSQPSEPTQPHLTYHVSSHIPQP